MTAALTIRRTLRTTLTAAALTATATVLATTAAPTAHPDTSSFVNMLRANGEPAGTPEEQAAAIELGWALCNLLNVSQSPDRTVDSLINRGHTRSDANIWLTASVIISARSLTI